MSVFSQGFSGSAQPQGASPTDLATQRTASSVLILSSTGADAVVPAADTALAGVLSAADKTKLDALAGALSLPDFNTFAEAAAASPTGDFLRTAGFATPGDGGGALYARAASDPGHGGVLQTSDGAFWDLAEMRVTPVMFGAVGDGAADDGPQLQAFFDYLTDNIHILGDFSGTWATAQQITVGGGFGSRFLSGMIQALGPMESVLRVVNGGLNFDGTLELRGSANGTPAVYENRETANGIILDPGGNTKFDRLVFRGFQRFGAVAATTGNNHINFGDMLGFDCGSIGDTTVDFGLRIPFTARADNGLLNPLQQSVLMTTGIPDSLRVNDIVAVGGRPLLVQEINGNELTVYPYPPAGITSGEIVAYHGGVLNMEANDAGLAWVESITSIRCGTAMRAASLYGHSVGKLHAEANGTGLILGAARPSSSRRVCIEGAYFENVTFHIIQMSGAASSVVIENPHLLNFDRTVRLSHVDAADQPVDPRLVGVTIVSQEIFTASAQRAFAETQATETLSNRPGRNSFFGARSSVTFQLSYDAAANRLYGLDRVEITAAGPGLNDAVTGALVIEPDADGVAAGITVNGVSSFSLPARSHPVYALARFDEASQDWRVSFTEIAPPIVASAALSGPSGGSTVDTEARATVNAILTVLRDQGLVAS